MKNKLLAVCDFICSKFKIDSFQFVDFKRIIRPALMNRRDNRGYILVIQYQNIRRTGQNQCFVVQKLFQVVRKHKTHAMLPLARLEILYNSSASTN